MGRCWYAMMGRASFAMSRSRVYEAGGAVPGKLDDGGGKERELRRLIDVSCVFFCREEQDKRREEVARIKGNWAGAEGQMQCDARANNPSQNGYRAFFSASVQNPRITRWYTSA